MKTLFMTSLQNPAVGLPKILESGCIFRIFYNIILFSKQGWVGGSGEKLYCIILQTGVGGWVENPGFFNYVISGRSLMGTGTRAGQQKNISFIILKNTNSFVPCSMKVPPVSDVRHALKPVLKTEFEFCTERMRMSRRRNSDSARRNPPQRWEECNNNQTFMVSFFESYEIMGKRLVLLRARALGCFILRPIRLRKEADGRNRHGSDFTESGSQSADVS